MKGSYNSQRVNLLGLQVIPQSLSTDALDQILFPKLCRRYTKPIKQPKDDKVPSRSVPDAG
jgi:hypothetical protein